MLIIDKEEEEIKIFFQDLLEKQQDLAIDLLKAIEENFWDLLIEKQEK